MYKNRIFSQNFLKSPELVEKLIRKSNISTSDIVIEIGPGKGIITKMLCQKAGHVIAVEADFTLATRLKEELKGYKNITVIAEDIRKFILPYSTYKVFSNIPFNITADIIYKLLYYSNPPTESFLVVQKEAAQKFIGIPQETQFSVLAKPWFNFEIAHKFNRNDFFPTPKVDSVLLHITKRDIPLIKEEDELEYKAFIKFAFNNGKKDLKIGLQKVFTFKQWVRLSKELKFNIHSKPTEISFDNWLSIFKNMKGG